MRPAWPALGMLMLLLAGCNDPAVRPAEDPAPTTSPDVDYPLTVRVSQETADGPAMPRVEVQAFILSEKDRPALPEPRLVPGSTDGEGLVRFTFEEPSLVAIRATAPGWTSEGQVVRVEESVTALGAQEQGGPILSERDLFLPLYRTDLVLTATTAMMTSTVRPGGNDGIESPVATAALVFPEGLAAPYLARLTAADVRVHWEDTASSRAHVAAGLAWDGTTWVRGEAPAFSVAPGPREASFSGPLPEEGRPRDLSAATLQAAAILESAAVGDVPLSFEVRLSFGGIEPAGLPSACHSREGCLLPIPLPLPTGTG